MGEPGGGDRVPVLRGDRSLVADHQRAEQCGFTRWQRLADEAADALSLELEPRRSRLVFQTEKGRPARMRRSPDPAPREPLGVRVRPRVREVARSAQAGVEAHAIADHESRGRLADRHERLAADAIRIVLGNAYR